MKNVCVWERSPNAALTSQIILAPDLYFTAAVSVSIIMLCVLNPDLKPPIIEEIKIKMKC